MKIKWILLAVVVVVGVFLWRYFRAREERNSSDVHQEIIQKQQQQLERLASERDSITELLRRREERYQASVDSLVAVIDRLQILQTQNRKQYENDRRSMVLMPHSEHYRYVSDYIARYADSLQP